MTNEEAKQILTDAFNGIWQVYGYMNSADAPSGQASEARWISVSEKLPLDGVLVVVKTKDGAKYFGSANAGKMMPNVAYWYPLPQE